MRQYSTELLEKYFGMSSRSLSICCPVHILFLFWSLVSFARITAAASCVPGNTPLVPTSCLIHHGRQWARHDVPRHEVQSQEQEQLQHAITSQAVLSELYQKGIAADGKKKRIRRDQRIATTLAGSSNITDR